MHSIITLLKTVMKTSPLILLLVGCQAMCVSVLALFIMVSYVLSKHYVEQAATAL